MNRLKIHSLPVVTLALAILFCLFISEANAERILYDSFEVVDSNNKPVGWQRAGHPSYISSQIENNNWQTPYGERGMSTYGTGVASRTVGFLPVESAGSGDYVVKFNITSSAAIGEYRAELWAINWVEGPILLGFAVGDTDGSKDTSFSDQITWRYNFDDWVDPGFGFSTMEGAELYVRLMQDPNRANWRHTPIWDNVSVDWDPDDDTTGPTLVDIEDDNGGGTVVATNAIVTYTVTFNEPMDAATVDTSDFGNAASADVIIESVTATPDGAVFLVGVRPTSGGTLRLKITEDTELNDIAGNLMDTASQLIQDNFTFVVEAGTPILLPADIVDDRGGLFCAENTLVIYTLTFSKDMNASTVTSADFGNAGSAPITIGTISEITPGVFTVEVTPTGSGTLQFRVNPGVDIRAADGGILNTSSAIADDTIIIVDSDPPTLTDFTNDTGGSPVAVGTLVTYEVFFSEDLDADTVDASDFGNAVVVGNAPFTINSVGMASPGVIRVELTPTGGGTIQLQVNAGAVLKDKHDNALDTFSAILDDMTITVDGTAPTLASTDIVNDKGGTPIPVGTSVTFTITFSEEMDIASVTPEDFGNAGTAPVTLGAVGAISPGVFTVVATPTGAGTLVFRVNAGAVLNDLAGNKLDTTADILDDTIITVQAVATDPFEAWAGGAAFNDDENGDGVANALAWVLGAATPNSTANALLPTFDAKSDLDFVIFTYRRKDDAHQDPNTVIAVQYGATLNANGWSTATHDGTNVIITETDDFHSMDPGIDRVQVRLRKSALAPGGRLFVRLAVSPAP